MSKDVQTEDSMDYTFYEASPTSAKCTLTFKVKAAHDAHIGLSSSDEQDATPIIEIFIGGWNNSKCAIRRDRSKPDRAEAETPDVLSGDELRGFWVTWETEGKIEVGREGEEEAFMSYVETEPFEITHYGIRTAWGATGEWEIGEARVSTGDSLPYQMRPAPCKVLSGRLVFSVQADHDAHVALSGTSSLTGCTHYEVFIGGWNNSKCALRKNGTKPDLVVAETPNALTSAEFKSFQLSWKNGLITLQDGNGAIIFEHQDTEKARISHYGVRTAWGARGQWKLGAEPQSPQAQAPPSAITELEPKAETPGEACWTAASQGEVPEGAVCGGSDQDCDLIIARAVHEGELIPGKFVPTHGVAYVSWNGAEHAKEDYEILCGCKAVWVQVNQGDELPENALPGGRTADGETLFVGRVPHENTVTLGKVHPSHATCYIPYGGQELGFPDFEILVRQ